MSLEKTLQRIDLDIQRGYLGKARDRLQGLIGGYPDDLSLRKKLGDIYYQLRYPEMAGRYWYLEEKKTDQMQQACDLFEKPYKDNPVHLVEVLKFKGDINKIESRYAKEKLLNLAEKCKQKGWSPKFSEKGINQWEQSPKSKYSDNLIKICFVGTIILILLLAIIGLISIIRWIL